MSTLDKNLFHRCSTSCICWIQFTSTLTSESENFPLAPITNHGTTKLNQKTSIECISFQITRLCFHISPIALQNYTNLTRVFNQGHQLGSSTRVINQGQKGLVCTYVGSDRHCDPCANGSDKNNHAYDHHYKKAIMPLIIILVNIAENFAENQEGRRQVSNCPEKSPADSASYHLLDDNI